VDPLLARYSQVCGRSLIKSIVKSSDGGEALVRSQRLNGFSLLELTGHQGCEQPTLRLPPSALVAGGQTLPPLPTRGLRVFSLSLTLLAEWSNLSVTTNA
jgi:hypothetical protein